MTISTAEFNLHYEGVSADDIQAEVDMILAELRDPGAETSVVVKGAGLDPSDLEDAEVTVRSTRSGFDPATILVGIAVSTGSAVAQTFWKEVIWPRLRRNLHLTTYEDGTSRSED